MRRPTPHLDRVSAPSDLRSLTNTELAHLATELRNEVISSVATTGGHLGSSLGVVELTVALHAVFDTPRDKLIWDVGHQCYPHKVLTGRRDLMHTLRQEGGLSGFTKRSESEFDPFGAAHSSTSISAALGCTVARDMGEPTGDAIAVIGDGSIGAGMAYEAMNNAGAMGKRMFVILNDNEMSIAPPVGAMSKYLSGLYASPLGGLKEVADGFEAALPGPLREHARRARQFDRFERFGERPNLVHLHQDRVGHFGFDALRENFAVRAEQVVAHQLAAIAHELREILPAVPIVFGHAVFDRHDRIVLQPAGVLVGERLRAQRLATALLEVVLATLEHLAGRDVERERDVGRQRRHRHAVGGFGRRSRAHDRGQPAHRIRHAQHPCAGRSMARCQHQPKRPVP